ncbi:hypothetical protein SARC_08560 [Sphaeroforma arctica JP610]|uniref:Telomeric single stranded DNA binding POT1/Cdc13 domain-containing protein n=1 Tax=Sphaeroforma arctica JP610 TaxID=667725 RepID=A0A0L0FQP6_9EUKA|nr:hypothetical protein SARC_08560 [Sphaeroforma arctica JP610]KNC79034.1 hypothetical protein SARC_08560 [Sphaeroforma arctica JP610]|eukprot:XP_014152936.1 hypothetical protein SARC_08560 [Sphaeroforma arctica JP610]
MTSNTYHTVSSLDLSKLSKGDTISHGCFKGRVLSRIVTNHRLRYELQDVSGPNANVYFAHDRGLFVMADFKLSKEEMDLLNNAGPHTQQDPLCTTTEGHRQVKDLLNTIQRHDVLTIRGIRVSNKLAGQPVIAPLATQIKVETAVERGTSVHIISGHPLRSTTSSPAIMSTIATDSHAQPTVPLNPSSTELHSSAGTDSLGESGIHAARPQPLTSSYSLPQPVRHHSETEPAGAHDRAGKGHGVTYNTRGDDDNTHEATGSRHASTDDKHVSASTKNIDIDETCADANSRLEDAHSVYVETDSPDSGSGTVHNSNTELGSSKDRVDTDNAHVDVDRVNVHTGDRPVNTDCSPLDTGGIIVIPRTTHIDVDSIDLDTGCAHDDTRKEFVTASHQHASANSGATCEADAITTQHSESRSRNRPTESATYNDRAKRLRTETDTDKTGPGVRASPTRTQHTKIGLMPNTNSSQRTTTDARQPPHSGLCSTPNANHSRTTNTNTSQAHHTNTNKIPNSIPSRTTTANTRQSPRTNPNPILNTPLNQLPRTGPAQTHTTSKSASSTNADQTPITNPSHAPRKRYHTIDEIMRMPLAQLPPKARELNVYGVVSWVGSCQTSSTGEFYRQLSVVDETVRQAMWDNAALKVMLFFKQRAAMPGDGLKVGDVIRFHRAQIDLYNGKPQLKKSGKAFQWVYFPMPTRPIAFGASGTVHDVPKYCGARPKHSPGLTANFTDFDNQRVRELVVMFHKISPPSVPSAGGGSAGDDQSQHTAHLIPTRTSEIRSLRHDTVASLIVQIVHPPRLPMKPKDFVANFFAWDGTSFAHSGLNPKHNKIVHVAAFHAHMTVAKAFKSGDWAVIVGGNITYQESKSRYRITVNDRPGIQLFKLSETHPCVLPIKRKILDGNIQFPGIPDDPAVSCAGFEEKCYTPIRDVKACESATSKYKIKGLVQSVTHDGIRSWHRICPACSKSYTPTPQVSETLKCLSCGNSTILSVLFEIEVRDVTGSLKVLVTGQEAKDFLCIDNDKDVTACLANLSLIKPEAHFECCIKSYELPTGYRVYQLFHTLLYASQPAH